MATTATLTVLGLADGDCELDYDGFAAFVAHDQVPDVGSVIAGRTGTAVKLSALIARARPDARHVNLRAAADAYHVSLTVADADAGLLVFGVAGGPISDGQGGPFRVFFPNLRDQCANLKQLEVIEFAAEPGRDDRPDVRPC